MHFCNYIYMQGKEILLFEEFLDKIMGQCSISVEKS